MKTCACFEENIGKQKSEAVVVRQLHSGASVVLVAVFFCV